MIEWHPIGARNGQLFVLRSDSSLSWHANKIFLYAMSGLSMVIGMFFAWLGLWPIFPFAGAEVGLLWAMVYLFKVRQCVREVLRIDDDEIVLQCGREGPRQEVRLTRHWTRLVVRYGPTDLHPKRLFLRCRGREIEIGAALGPHDRNLLANRLAGFVTPIFERSWSRPSGFQFG